MPNNLLCVLNQFLLHTCMKSHTPAHEIPTKDRLLAKVFFFTALAAPDRDMRYIMVENAWSWFPE